MIWLYIAFCFDGETMILLWCWPLLIDEDYYVVIYIQVLTTGALHLIDFTSIRTAAVTWQNEFANVRRPLLVVNIGGPTRNFYCEFNHLKCHNFHGPKNLVIRLISVIDLGNCRYGVDLAKQLAASLLSVLVSCGSVRISFSERTPQKVFYPEVS